MKVYDSVNKTEVEVDGTQGDSGIIGTTKKNLDFTGVSLA